MALINRRRFLKSAGAFGMTTGGLGSYAFGIEPGLMLGVTPYELTPPGWAPGLRLRPHLVSA